MKTLAFLLTFFPASLSYGNNIDSTLPPGYFIKGISFKNNSQCDPGSVPSGCTVITFSRDGRVFFGGNDDYINPDSYYWVEQGDSSKYGVIWIGTPDNPQQGVNEKGLAYDSNGLPRVDVNPHMERIPVNGEYHEYMMRIMHECATVDEVIAWVNTHQRPPYMHDQLHFADKTGDAVIISAGKDGEMVFTRKAPGNGFLVSTNFNVANPSNGFGYPCPRFDKATEMMKQLMEQNTPPDINDATAVLDAVHVEKGSSWTLETMVTDLVDGIMYLYYFYQYDKPVILNIKEELANPRKAGPFSSLFPDEVKKEAAKRFTLATGTIRRNNIIGKSWCVTLIFSIGLMFFLFHGKKGLKLWLPASVILGPVALFASLPDRNQDKKNSYRGALIETTGDLIPLAAGTLLSTIIVIRSMLSGGSGQLIQLLFLIIPFITAWMIFHGPLLSAAGRIGYFRFQFQRMPQVVVTSFLGLAGIFTVSMPLVNKSLSMSQVMPLSPWMVMTWWAITAAGSVAGGLLIYFYELWSVRKGYKAWMALSGDDIVVKTPGWGRLWWWILVAITVLIAGLIIAVKLLQNSAAG